MRLWNRPLERRIRREVKREIARSPALRRERKRARRRSRSIPGDALGFWLLIAFLAARMAFCHFERHGAWTLFALSLLVTGAALFMVSKFQQQLSASQEVYVLAHFPVSDAAFFNRQWRKTLGATLGIAGLTVVTYGAALASAGHPPGHWVWAIVLGAAQWAAAASLLLLAARWLPGVPHAFIGVCLFAAGMALTLFAGKLMRIMAIPAGWLYLTPSGWISLAFQRIVAGQDRLGWACALPALCLVPPAVLALRSLRAAFVPGEAFFGEQTTAESIRDQLARDRGGGPDGDAVDGAQLRGFEWKAWGLIERAVFRVLTGRERACADFLSAQIPKWTSRWRRSLIFSLLGAASLAFLGGQPFVQMTGFVLLGIGTATALPLLGGAWDGLRVYACGATTCAVVAGYPLDYGEISRTMLKINLIRMFAWLPLGLFIGWFLAWQFPLPGTQSPLLHVAAGFLLALAYQPFVVGMRLMGLTSAAARITARSAVFLLLTAVAGLLLVAAGATVFIPGALWLKAAGIGAAAVVSLASWQANRLLHDRWFDLLSPIREA